MKMNAMIVGLCGTLMSFSASAAESPLKIQFKSAKQKNVGTATLTEKAQGVLVQLDLTQLPPGKHAIHIHQNGKCGAPSFESAGGHYNPSSAEHGFNHEKGPHPGDLPNLVVDKGGRARVEFFAQNVMFLEGSAPLLKEGGTSLVIHEKEDDHQSQPSGDSGKRIACAEIKK